MTKHSPGGFAPKWPRISIAVAGLGFALVALLGVSLIGLQVSANPLNSTGRVTLPTLAGGVFIAGCLFWWLLMARQQRPSLWRGAAAGILTALVSYPLVLTLAEILQPDWVNPATLPTLAEHINTILLATGLMLMTSGFAATLVMAVVGAAMAWGFRRQPVDEVWHPPGLVLKLAGVVIGAVVVGLAGSFVWLTTLPRDLSALAQRVSPTSPARTYDEAIAAFEIVERTEAGLPLNAHCRSKLLTHGFKTARVVIYFHGFTSCPAQGDALAARLFAAGDNVLLPRMAGHGAANPAAFTMAELTAGNLIDLANTSIDIAQGLGDSVTVIGLSAGGTMASWAAQQRADVDQAVAVSPFFGPYVVPTWANRAASNFILVLPNLTLWWNPLENVAPPRAEYKFARPSTHALAQIMVLGGVVATNARAVRPAATRINVLLNGADVLVNNSLTKQLIAAWRSHGKTVGVATLPFSAHLPHDIINPHEHGANTDLVYPRLTELVNGADPD